ncbi:SHOCT domain-containing protein [Salmonella enterica]|nr:SHOCT domain-containing protein [Salmonella enterica]EHO5708877.1 SHOCT domain-containing protein [Salmonella enterica]EJJ0783327.1 SHOCT domain-containing protein [Salmonella enterica]
MSKYEVRITGDNGGLRRSTDQAIEMLDNLSDKAMNLDLSGGLKGLGGSLRGVGGSLGLVAGGFAGVAAGAISAASAVADYVKQYNEVSKATGLTVETLQKLEKQFSGTGLTVEKFGDINKDTMDKLADAWRNGGGVADDLESVGLSIKDYAEFMNDPQGGMKAAIKVFYDMRKAGASLSDVKFMMESLASDSSHMADELQKYGSYQEAVNKINEQTVKVTDEAAKEYDKFSKNMDTLGGNLKGLAADALNPVVDGMNRLFDWFEKDWEKTKLYNALKTFNERFEKTRDNMAMANGGFISKRGYSTTGLAGGQASFNNKPNYPDRWTDSDGNIRDKDGGYVIEINKGAEEKKGFTPEAEGGGVKGEFKKDQEEAQKARESALKAAEKAAQEAQKRREQALKDLNALNIQMYSQSQAAVASSNAQLVESLDKLENALDQGVITQEQYQAKRKALIEANADNFYNSIMGMSPVDALQALAASKEIYNQSLEDLQAQYDQRLISHQDYLQRKADLEAAYSAREGATKGLADRKFGELSSSIGGFAFEEEFANQTAEADRQYQSDKDNINKSGLPEEQRMKLLEQAERKHKKTLIDIENQAADARLSIVGDMFGGMTSALQMFGLENTAVGKTMFAAQKGAAIAQATIDTYAAANKALASAPAPMNYALAAGAVARGIANVAQIKSTSLDGMAHDGIDNIPREGTWLLQKGERVVDDRTNGDLKEFLSNQKSGESNVAPIEVHAPLTIQGNVNSADKMVMDAIKRHGQFVAQAVQDANRRRM